MTDYKTTLKSNIQTVELSKKKVKINCYNKNSGNLAVTTLSQNSSIFNGHNYDINKGIDGAKDFTVKFDDKDHAEQFKNAIQTILDDTTVVAEAPELSAWEKAKEKINDAATKIGNTASMALTGQPMASADAPTGNVPSGDAPTGNTPAGTSAPTAAAGDNGGGNDDSGSNKLLIIGGAVVLVLVLALVIWKAGK